MLKKIFFAGIFIPALSFANQQSAFEAGNLNSENPYGLTDTEKALLDNKKKVDTLKQDYTGVDFKTNKALEQIEGLQGIVDDISTKTYNQNNKILQIENTVNTNNININTQIESINKELASQKIAIAQLKKAINELVKLIQNANENINDNKKEIEQQESKKTPNQQMNEAIELFQAKKYDPAKSIFYSLAQMRHKPALSNFYLGQIAFEKKEYNDAVYFYKNSVNLYKAQGVKANNMPEILFKTAKSLEYLGQKENAQVFYEALKQEFPNSKEAKSVKF
ncbi:tetratricopeptide repeat protein [Campylobacter canadensis]|uniref:Tetratricopeptide repeat protein n=1 Tax=Campylobacter canadensis TaxID=449520 RepID=A0ABS7WSU8_9BACT|nr:tetratricopeptide repeat protein [Campylobacter canadensis]MBZ7987357.1 hypothetical protein [Campylobacter canadensis]MBZ7994760.1 hypothetical protein [Campylobacter canadensis]MBZ7996532.1 hypothetical protein [Campylobacter canadensis]MBZ7998472.1 hypothetical protein [Campylobacter canadensis]MBZ8000186.1 hypothetical protein [Campylobacter canadensis]